MSWWVSLTYKDGDDWFYAQVPSHEDGGTFALGGTYNADLNVTYNYSMHIAEAFDGVHLDDAINGKRAADVSDFLEKAVIRLGTQRADDYWAPTPGNAGYALSVLSEWASQHPEATFSVN